MPVRPGPDAGQGLWRASGSGVEAPGRNEPQGIHGRSDYAVGGLAAFKPCSSAPISSRDMTLQDALKTAYRDDLWLTPGSMRYTGRAFRFKLHHTVWHC